MDRDHPPNDIVQQVQGDHNLNLAVGGDFVAGSQYIQHLYPDSDFQEPSLREVERGRYETPPIAERLISELRGKRVLVLGGERLPDKSSLALHLAWMMVSEGTAKTIGGTPLELRECICGAGAVRVDKALHISRPPTLLLLQAAEPRHIGFDLQGLRRRIAPTSHLVLVTTDSPAEAWRQNAEGSATDGFVDLDPAQVFGEIYMAHCLRRHLANVERFHPADLFPERLPQGYDEDLDLPLVAGLTLREVGRELLTPDRARLLAAWLLSQAEQVTAEQVREQLQRIRGEDAAIGSWYLGLEPHLQRLVVGLTLFEGLFDDQLFGALDHLFREVWRHRLPRLDSFDYKDLEAVAGYFRLTETRSGGLRVFPKSEQHAKSLFDAVWNYQRRHLIATLPVLSNLAQTSCARSYIERMRTLKAPKPSSWLQKLRFGSSSEKQTSGQAANDTGPESAPAPPPTQGAAQSRWEDYGPERELISTPERRQELEETLGRALGQIASRSPFVAERCLLELAQHPSDEAHAVAALALVTLLQTAHEPYLLRTMVDWYRDAEDKDRAMLRAGKHPEDTKRYAHLKATVAIVLARTAALCAPGKFPSHFADLLRKLAQQSSEIVRKQLREQTLPAIVDRHQDQLDELLWDLVYSRDLIEPIAFGWAHAHQHRPDEARRRLAAWTQRCIAQAPTPLNEPAQPREARLATVALCYGFIDYRNPAPSITLAFSLEQLRGLLRENHSYVRQHVFRAIGLLIRGHFEQLEASLLLLIQGLDLADRQEITQPLLGVYLSQREALQGGDGEVRVGNTSYAVWRGTDRPPTQIEQTLRRWLTTADHPEGQQLALATFTAIHGSTLAQAEDEWRRQRPRSALTAASVARPPEPRRRPLRSLRTLPLPDRLALAVLTFGRPDLKEVLSALAAEAPFELKRHSSAFERLLSEWRRRRGKTGTIGRHLVYLAFFHRWWPVILPLVLVAGFFLSRALRSVFQEGG